MVHSQTHSAEAGRARDLDAAQRKNRHRHLQQDSRHRHDQTVELTLRAWIPKKCLFSGGVLEAHSCQVLTQRLVAATFASRQPTHDQKFKADVI